MKHKALNKAFVALAAFAGLACNIVHAQSVEVKDGWVRSTVAGQTGTGAFMKITAKEGARLVGISSPLAGIAEVHEMKMVKEQSQDIMQMRALPELDLPAGKTVELKSGGYHVMLMDLKQPLAQGSKVPVTLRFKNAKGTESKLELTLPVSAVAPSGTAIERKANDKAADHDTHKH